MDKIGDLLNRISTASPHSKKICVPNSKYKRAILKVLFEEGWILGITEKTNTRKSDESTLFVSSVENKNFTWADNHEDSKENLWPKAQNLIIYLKRPYIDASNFDWKNLNLKVLRISKPGRRVYYTAKETKKLVYKITNIASTIVISTNKGIMTVNKAANLNLGGELLFKISTLS